MRRSLFTPLLTLAALGPLAAGCSPQPDDAAAPSAEEDRQLNDAAAALDVNAATPSGHPAP